MMEYYFEKENGKWSEIAKYMPGRNESQCMQRWRRLKKPNLIRNKWTEKDNDLLKKLVVDYNKNWGAIAKHFKERSSK
jgi:hypothetical protein